MWDEKPIRDYSDWLKSIALDFDENAVLQRFSEYLMLPYEFWIKGKKAQMIYLPGELDVIAEDRQEKTTEDEFRTLWFKWKNEGVIACEEADRTLLLVMLKSMDYLEPVFVEKPDGLCAGYQMLLMRDRANKMI